MSAFQYFLRHHPVTMAVLALALGAMLVMGFHAGRDFVYFNDPAHQQQSLEAWMTPRYVGMSWRLPPEVVARILNLGPHNGPDSQRHPTLGDIAQTLGITLPELEARIRAAATEGRP